MSSESFILDSHPKATIRESTKYGGLYQVIEPIQLIEARRLGLRNPFRVLGGWCTSPGGAWWSAVQRMQRKETQ